MLHMVVLTHAADTCAAAHPEAGSLMRDARTQADAVAAKADAKIQSWWIDPPAHVIYMVVDAPNAHAVNNIMVELKLFFWNTVDVHPVVTVDEAMALAAR